MTWPEAFFATSLVISIAFCVVMWGVGFYKLMR
jgi:hypothetical protein